MNINDKYNELTGDQFGSLNLKVRAFIPTPTDKDYVRGYITRYFAQKTNDISSHIYEVSDVEFKKLTNSVMYNTTTLRWRIVGPKEPTDYEDNKIVDIGVKESNRTAISFASEYIVNLKLYLPNLTQFHKS